MTTDTKPNWRDDFRLGFFDLNTVRVSEPEPPQPTAPQWIEGVPSLARIVDDLERDWAPVADFGGALPSGASITGVPTGAGWSCTPASGYPINSGTVTCTRSGTLANGASAALLTVPAVANVNGTVTAAFAVSGLQSHLHVAEHFVNSASVGERLHADPRANKAQVAFEVACAWSRAERHDRALEWVGRAIDDGFTAGSVLDGEQDLAETRRDPGWSALRARLP